MSDPLIVPNPAEVKKAAKAILSEPELFDFIDPTGLNLKGILHAIGGWLNRKYEGGLGGGSSPSYSTGEMGVELPNDDEGEGGGGGPQKKITDSNKDCSLTVRYLGPEAIRHRGGIMDYGAAFIVSGTVRSSSIGRVGDPGAAPDVLKEVKGDQRNGGEWTIGQWIHPLDNSTTWADGKPAPGNPRSPVGKTTDDSPRPYSRNVNARNFWWGDSPGYYSFPRNPLVSGSYSANFTVYAYDRNGHGCWVNFNVSGTFSNGQWTTSFGPPK